LKKTIISLLLTMTFILSMSTTVIAGNDEHPRVIVRDAVEQCMAE